MTEVNVSVGFYFCSSIVFTPCIKRMDCWLPISLWEQIKKHVHSFVSQLRHDMLYR